MEYWIPMYVGDVRGGGGGGDVGVTSVCEISKMKLY